MRYDPDQRRAADLLQRYYPRWIMYGAWTRRFWAYSAFATRHGRTIVLAAPDADSLAAWMRDAEAAHGRPAWGT